MKFRRDLKGNKFCCSFILECLLSSSAAHSKAFQLWQLLQGVRPMSLYSSGFADHVHGLHCSTEFSPVQLTQRKTPRITLQQVCISCPYPNLFIFLFFSFLTPSCVQCLAGHSPLGQYREQSKINYGNCRHDKNMYK